MIVADTPHTASGEHGDVSQTPVVILCGGLGTRLKEETEFVPKPLVKIGEFPVLWHVMKIYQAQGFRKFILLVGHKGEKIKEYFYSYPIHYSDFTLRFHSSGHDFIQHTRPSEDWEVTLIDTGRTSESGVRLKKAAGLLQNSTFMLTYADGVADINLHELLSVHRASGKMATVSAVRPPGRFGELAVSGNVATGFQEKPSSQSGLINGGFFAMEPGVFRFFPDEPMLHFEKDVLPKIAAASELAVYRHPGYWQCMDTLRDMELLNEKWNAGEAPWKIWKD
ncbi:MAG: glucose-1-phosphate cytidylyltransferase [Patescibacteria group bacterium]